MVSIIKYNAKKRTYTGTNENDVLDASILNYEPIGKTNIKKNLGLIITGGNGDDKITGTDYNDTIKGGNGNDRITGGLGVDNITGGAGITTINYSKGDGNDIINLTKGENFTLNFTDLSKNHLRFEIVNKNKDLRIYTSKMSNDEYITIKNFVKKDVTNNSNTKKKLLDTSSVELMFNNVESSRIDLRTATDLYKSKVSKNYTGTWLSEEIDASGYQRYMTVGKGKNKHTEEDNDTAKKGLTIKSKAGNDTITGSKYSDKIYGNTGTDTINAGTGNNYIYMNKGDGNDIVENGGGIDTLVFAKKTNLTYSYDKYDLIIKYSDNDTVTLKDYLKGHSVKYVQIGKTLTILNPPKPKFIEYNEDGYHVIEGTDNNDTIVGTNNNDKIIGKDGNDIINASHGNDIIDGGVGDDIYIFDTGDGIDTILSSMGKDTIKFINVQNITYSALLNYDLIINYGDSDKIILKDYFEFCIHSVKNIINGMDKLIISDEIPTKTRIIGTNKDDVIINDGFVVDDGIIDGLSGNDTITNNGTVYGELWGGAGNDIITNNGIIRLEILGASGDDIITTGQDSYAERIHFEPGDGDDILYLNASVNNLHIFNYAGNFVSIKNLIINWNNDDLVISYNNSKDSITIKDYNPLNSNVKINVNNRNLATLVPEKPAPLMMMSSPMMSTNELSEQVASFTSTNSDMSLNYNDVQNTSDTSSLIAEYTPEQVQIM